MKSKKHLGFWVAIENVIGFVLSERLAKIRKRIFWFGVTLYRKIAALHGVEQVKTNWEFVTKTLRRITQNGTVIVKHQAVKRNLEQQAIARECETVFWGYQLEAPSVIGCVLRQFGNMLFNPLPTPRTWLEPRTSAKKIMTHLLETFTQICATHENGLIWALGIHDKIQALEKFRFMQVEYYPIDKIKSFISGFHIARETCPKVMCRPRSSAKLNLVFGDIEVYQCACPTSQRRTAPVNDIDVGICIWD